MECEKTVLQGVMEDKELEMEGGGCSGQFGCRKEEGRGTEIEAKMEGMKASNEYQPAMEDFDESRCVLGTLVGVLSDQGLGQLSIEFHQTLPPQSLPVQLIVSLYAKTTP